ncbi:MAG TPA: RNA polymerase sigma factor, partial [Cytophagales bacterium]|nr:RNA polymerase sigma factor [Cytophagales bacterium]
MISEKDILLACQKSTPEGQRLLYLKYAPLLKAVCYRYIKDKDEAADVLQDAFVKIFKKIKDFKGQGSLEGWLKKVVVNTTLDFLQKKKVRAEITYNQEDCAQEVQIDVDADEEGIVSKIVNLGFTKESLVQLLHELPEPYATVFNLFFIDEISHKEIAGLLNT